ncbi:MAG: hypothetical protein JXR37_23355 [Kiritimatiellae bacterium]|nr:hypothetical protein [Kiritimatiellia bacterium]
MKGSRTKACVCVALLLACLPGAGALGEARYPARRVPDWAKPGEVSSRRLGPGMWGYHVTVAIHPTNPDIAFTSADMGASLARTLDGGKSWQHVGNLDRGQQIPLRPSREIFFHPKKPRHVWTSDVGGLYQSADLGETWVNLAASLAGKPDGFGNSYFFADPVDPEVGYALKVAKPGKDPAVAPAVMCYRTCDGWKTIERRSGPDSAYYLHQVRHAAAEATSGASRERRRIYIWGEGGVLCSPDAGRSWRSVNGDLPGGTLVGGALVMDGVKPVLFACLDPWGVYRSDDAGHTWQARNKGLEGIVRQPAASGAGAKRGIGVGRATAGTFTLCAGDPRIGYIAFDRRGAYRTQDGGLTWMPSLVTQPRAVQVDNGTGRKQALKVPGKGKDRLSPRAQTSGRCSAIVVSPVNPKIAMMSASVILRTDDGGKTWWDAAVELGSRFQPLDRFTELDAATRFTHRLRPRGSGTFDQVAWDMAADPFDQSTLAIGYQEVGLQISRDDGQWWEWSCYGSDDMYSQDDIAAIAYDPVIRDRVYMGLFGKLIFTRGFPTHGRESSPHRQHCFLVSDDGGRTWNRVPVPPFAERTERIPAEKWGNVPSVFDIAVSRDPRTRRGRIVIATPFGLFGSDDEGRTWQEGDFGADHPMDVFRVALDPRSPDTVYAGVLHDSGKWGRRKKLWDDPDYPRGLYRSTDGGKHFRQLGQGLIGGVLTISICHGAPDTLYVTALPKGVTHRARGTAHELWTSKDGGAGWQRVDLAGLYMERAVVHPVDPRVVYLYASDAGRNAPTGMYRSADGGGTWQKLAAGIMLAPGVNGHVFRFDPVDARRFFVFDNVSAHEVWDLEQPSRASRRAERILR